MSKTKKASTGTLRNVVFIFDEFTVMFSMDNVRITRGGVALASAKNKWESDSPEVKTEVTRRKFKPRVTDAKKLADLYENKRSPFGRRK